MKAVNLLRTDTGITQEDLAQLLGISRSMVVKAERGICSLDTMSLMKLARLQQYSDECAGALKMGGLSLPEKLTDHKIDCGKRLETCRYHLLILQRKLSRLDTSFARYARLYSIFEALEKAEPGEASRIANNKKKLAKKLGACGEAARWQLKKRIHLLSAEIDYINSFSGSNDAAVKADV